MSEHRTIVSMRTDELSAQQIADIRGLLWAAFADDEHGAFTEEDWQHSIGGTHFLGYVADELIAHASVVERTLHVHDLAIRTGYVEAVATAPQHQRRGHGTALMREVDALIEAAFSLGALGTGSQAFYERLGWRIWRGPPSVRTADGVRPTPEDDGYIMVLLIPATPPGIDLSMPISCEWRPGDVW